MTTYNSNDTIRHRNQNPVKTMTDDEVEKELRRVQLQREKLLLEKEMARKEILEKSFSTAGSAFSFINSFVLKILRISLLILNYIKNKYKKILGLFFALAIMIGLFFKYVEVSEINYNERLEDYAIKKCSGIISKSCEGDKIDNLHYYACYKQRENHRICLIKSENEYEKIEKPPFDFLN